MTATTQLDFPVQIHFTHSDDVARALREAGEKAMKPQWAHIAIVVAVSLQAVVQAPKLMAGGNGGWVIGFLPLGFGYLAFMFWLGHKKRGKLRAALFCPQLIVTFFTDALELGSGSDAIRIRYSGVRSIGRDDRGLFFSTSSWGQFVVPAAAFGSVEQRDQLFSYLGALLRSKS